MGLEAANFISQLDESWPTGLDPINKGDDHLRLIKQVLKDQFPGTAGDGYDTAILATEEDLNNCTLTLGNLQAQITANADAGVANTLGIAPIGGIILYNAVFANIPANWQLCDGTNGTPDMTDQFVYGTNTEGELLAAGGSADAVVVSHSHTIGSDGAHTHPIPNMGQVNPGSDTEGGGGDPVVRNVTGVTSSAGAHTHSLTTDGEDGTGKNVPNYIKLAYIQRMT